MKHFFSTAMALMAIGLFAACSSEDVTSVVQDQQDQQAPAISFYNYLGRAATRGTITDGTSISTDGVGVFAMYTKDGKYGEDNYVNFDPNFMYNVKVHGPEGTNARWTYSPLRYWPTSAKDYVSFLAYGPWRETAPKLCDASGSTPAETGNLTWIKHEVSTDVAKQVDFIRGRIGTTNMQIQRNATTGVSTYKSDNSSAFTGNSSTTWYKDVNLKMIHACSRIAVVISAPALLDEKNYVYTAGEKGTVKSNTVITVNKVMLLGDNTSATGETPTGAFYPSAYLNLAGNIKGSAGKYTTDFWSNKATNGKLAFTLDKFANGTYDAKTKTYTAAGYNIWKPTTTETNVIQGTMTNGTPSSIKVNDIGTKNDNYLFVIPQNFTTSDNPLYCYIEYTVSYKEGTTGDVASKGVVCSAYGKIEQDMTAGSAYVIHINIGSDGGATSLNAIQFHVSVDAWADEAGTDVQI